MMMMKQSLLLALIGIQNIVLTIDTNEQDAQKWDSYKTNYNKKYEGTDEEEKKKKIYNENLNKISEHNSRFQQGLESYEMGMNHFGDMTPEEFTATYLHKPGAKPAEASEPGKKPAGVSKLQMKIVLNQETEEESLKHFNFTLPADKGHAPRAKNWVHEGAVTRVKNQGKCGCCWAFAVAAGIESHAFIHKKKLQSLSPQNILDCLRDRYGTENDCKQGAVINALRFVQDNGGIQTEKSYPYKEEQSDTCHYDPAKKAVTIKDFKRLLHGDKDQVRDVVGLIGPVICGFNVEFDKFVQFYKSGIYSSNTCEETMESINHSFLIVGYGTEDRLDYWIVKNSWGTGWGEKGYARIAKPPNTCGITTDCFFPVL